MGTIASQITSLTIVYSALYSGADQSKHQCSASLAFVWRIHRGPVNSPHKWPVTRKMSPFDDVIMLHRFLSVYLSICLSICPYVHTGSRSRRHHHLQPRCDAKKESLWVISFGAFMWNIGERVQCDKIETKVLVRIETLSHVVDWLRSVEKVY